MENFGTTPGLQPGPGAARAGAVAAERDAVAITMAMLRSADLILRCGDAGSLPLPLPPGVRPSAGTIDVALRIDLGAAAFPRDLDLAAPTGRGIDALSAAIRERLVPAKLIDDGKPWAFWLSATRPG